MKCPYCGEKSKVSWTQDTVHESLPEPARQRRRACGTCSKPFYTYEVYSTDFRRMVQIMESADLLEELSGLIRTRLKLGKGKNERARED